MTTLTPDLIQQIAHLTPTQQTTLAAYLQTHLNQILATAEKEHHSPSLLTFLATLDDLSEDFPDIDEGLLPLDDVTL